MKNIDFKSQNAIIKGNNENKSNIIKIKIQQENIYKYNDV